MKLDPKVFKAYDVRGPVPDAFDAEGAGRIALALVALLRREGAPKRPIIVVARDARPSSDELVEAVRTNLVRAGAEVIDLGLSTSPMFYFGVNHLNADGGIMITASHNPPPDNGMKMVRRGALAIGGGVGMEEVRDLAFSDAALTATEEGTVREASVLDVYVTFLLGLANVDKPLSVVIDTGNGMSAIVLEALLPKLAAVRVEKLYFDIDLTFPNHEANPLKEETLKDLKAKVVETGADLGVAFDGDGDRIGFVTEKGEVVRGDFITALLVKGAVERFGKNQQILFEVKSSRVVPETIEAAGGIPVRIATGHATFSHKLREGGGLLGGELSGHYYFRETFNRDGTMLVMIRIFSMIAGGTPLSELVAPLKKRYVQSGEVNFEVTDKEAALKRIAAAFPDGKHSTIDGLTVEYPDWWFNVRTSNTEDLLRLNVEAKSEALRDEMFMKLEKLIDGERQ